VKIALLVSSMHSGGAERVAATLCNAWARRGDEVTLVATYSGRGECHYPLADGVRLVYLADLAGGSRGAVLGYGARLLALRRLLRRQGPDVVVSFLTNVNINAILATRGLGIPLIVCERTDPLASADHSTLTRLACRLLYPLADIVTVQTESVADRLRAYIPKARRIDVVPNPVSDALLDVRRAECRRPRRRLLAIGRLSPEKQFNQLIDVYAGLAGAHPDVDLWIWGEGPLRRELEGQVDRLGLRGRVFLPGRTESPWAEMARGEIVVLTSAYEGFPNVMLEAMAIGLPCVAYDCPSGPRELSRDGQVARLVPLNDRNGLRNAIVALLDDAVLRRQLGAAAAASARRHYRLDAIVARWDRLILAARDGRGFACA
jgi:glycosyltransferase involved in cell wall biosynthesis